MDSFQLWWYFLNLGEFDLVCWEFCVLHTAHHYSARRTVTVRVCDTGCTDRNVQLISDCTQTLSVLNYRHISPPVAVHFPPMPICLLGWYY